jgi:hypothetical protein
MKIHPMLHIFLLEPYHVSTIPRRIHDPPPPIEVNGEQGYEMEDILDSWVKFVNSSILFIGMGMM